MARSQAASDLLWVVNSPSFVTGTQVAPAVPLDPGQIDEDALATFLEPRRSHRVGHYFEHLLHFWLAEIRHLDMVAAGLQIREGKRTVGEIDFLYRDEAGLLTHCEASVKFFLHHPRAETSHFPGPNAIDNFERKVDKLFTSQLQLSVEYHPEVQQRHAFVKGMVFCHDTAARPTVLPPRMPASALSGRWYRAAEISELRLRQGLVGAIADKPYWLAPCPQNAVRSLTDLCDDLEHHFRTRGHPVMVSLRDEATGDEVERAFVVAHTWPES